MLVLYMQILEQIVLSATPLAVGALAIRRLILSRSFNRLLYALVLLHCTVVIELLSRGGQDSAMLDTILHAAGYSPAILWLYVLVVADSTRGSPAGWPY